MDRRQECSEAALCIETMKRRDALVLHQSGEFGIEFDAVLFSPPPGRQRLSGATVALRLLWCAETGVAVGAGRALLCVHVPLCLLENCDNSWSSRKLPEQI